MTVHAPALDFCLDIAIVRGENFREVGGMRVPHRYVEFTETGRGK